MSATGGSGCSTPQRSVSGEDSDSDLENEHIRPRGLTGLQNLGNTCYLNSAVQSLSNCPPLTQYFLDCAQLIRPEKAPMISRSYLKLMTELWHKRRPSYVVPSGVVTGIKAVHPMFRGYTQQDAQEFLRCLMDQLHEELKVAINSDDSDDEEDDDGGGNIDDDTNNGNSAGDGEDERIRYHSVSEPPTTCVQHAERRPSFDSVSSHSELDYETCDSGLSSERSSTAERDNISSDGNISDSHEPSKLQQRADRTGKNTETATTLETADSVANTKEMKETANLLHKKNETENQGRRPRKMLESGDSREQGIVGAYVGVPTKDEEMQTVSMSHTAGSVQREHSSHSFSHQQSQQQKSPVKKQTKQKKTKNIKYDSIISQTFDGKILSSVRCLNCETVSTTKETFQDLSLPIPSKDHLHMLHSGYHQVSGGVTPPKGGACGEVHQGWMAWMFSWMKSWFIGPVITLQDCLSAFFSADELKGDNMYSCEKCKKLRNGLKYSKVLECPEILSIHLKRFRHEFYSSKINTYISFPLEGLEMDPYLQKACKNEVTTYDLVAIICHHGTAGGGHYTAYCLNHVNEQWYEFDDQYVTEVDVSQVQNCEAYVLFYRKSNKKIESMRQRVMELETNEMSILRFYLSKQWVSKFHTFAEPGPITNSDFLCKHGGVPPGKVNLIDDLVVEIHQSTWELIYNRFGGGPVCNHLYACKTCHSELEKLRQRQKLEKESFIQLNEEFQEEEQTSAVYAISMAWFKEWEAFVREKSDFPPDAIDNSRIIVNKNGQPTLRPTSDHGQLSSDMWFFLHRIYGGGPELLIRQSSGVSVKPSGSSPVPTSQVQGSSPQATQTTPSMSQEKPSVSPPHSTRANSPPRIGSASANQTSTNNITSQETVSTIPVSISASSVSPVTRRMKRNEENALRGTSTLQQSSPPRKPTESSSSPGQLRLTSDVLEGQTMQTSPSKTVDSVKDKEDCNKNQEGFTSTATLVAGETEDTSEESRESVVCKSPAAVDNVTGITEVCAESYPIANSDEVTKASGEPMSSPQAAIEVMSDTITPTEPLTVNEVVPATVEDSKNEASHNKDVSSPINDPLIEEQKVNKPENPHLSNSNNTEPSEALPSNDSSQSNESKTESNDSSKTASDTISESPVKPNNTKSLQASTHQSGKSKRRNKKAKQMAVTRI